MTVRKFLSHVTFKKLVKEYNFEDKVSMETFISLGNHLYFRVNNSSHSQNFVLRYGKKISKLGSYPELSYQGAVSMVLEFLNKIASKPKDEKSKGKRELKIVDRLVSEVQNVGVGMTTPNAEQQSVKSAKFPPYSFFNVAHQWLETKKSLSRYANIRKCVDYLAPLDYFDVRKIKNNDVKDALLSQKITPYKLHECLETFFRIMDYAIELDFISSHSFRVLAKSSAFPKHKVGEGYKYCEFSELDKMFEIMAALPEKLKAFFLMQIFTCLRPGECRQLQFSYFDLEKKILSVPGEIMKIKTTHPFRVPITPQIKALFLHIKEHLYSPFPTDYLFTSNVKNTPMSEVTLSQSLKLVTDGKVQPHGFRKTARSFFAEHGVALEVAAMCLAHQLDTGADRFYQKSDLLSQRMSVLCEWNSAVEKILPQSFKKLLNN